MKYCSHCGANIEDDVKFCPHCGCAVENETVEITNNNHSLTMAAEVLFIIPLICCAIGAILFLVFSYMGAFRGYYIFSELYALCADALGETDITLEFFNNFICIFFAALYLISLTWTIPMTVHLHKARKFDKRIGTAFKIWTIFLFGLIPAILLFCRKEPQ